MVSFLRILQACTLALLLVTTIYASTEGGSPSDLLWVAAGLLLASIAIFVAAWIKNARWLGIFIAWTLGVSTLGLVFLYLISGQTLLIPILVVTVFAFLFSLRRAAGYRARAR